MIEVSCPACGKKAKAPEEHIGKKGICPQCRNPFIISRPPQESDSNPLAFLQRADAGTSPPPMPEGYQAKEEPKSKGLLGSLFGKKQVAPDLLESYSVVYKGGHSDYPKEKAGKITFNIFPDRFELSPTLGTRSWFKGLVIPYSAVARLEIVQRQLGTLEGILGGLGSRQLNQPNNIHITYQAGSQETVLRLEMLSGVTVMGQAKKCQELIDRLRTHQILGKFQGTPGHPTAKAEDITAQIEKLAALRKRGILTEDEFQRKKSELLARL